MGLFKKTAFLKEGICKSVMRLLLMHVKQQRGMYSFIQRGGVNGRYLNPDAVYNITVSQYFKILEKKAKFQSDEEFLEDWKNEGEFLLKEIRKKDSVFEIL